MLTGLLFTAFLMGAGGIPHCAVMCGAACAAALPRGVSPWSLLGRCLGYAILGGVAAASVGLLASWGRQIAMLKPLWMMSQLVAVMMGLWLLWSGRVPSQIEAWGQNLFHRVRTWVRNSSIKAYWPFFSHISPFLAGLAWAFMPCGLLYAALTVAVLAPSWWGGAAVMLAFALPSAVGVWAAPVVIQRLWRPGVGVSRRDAATVLPMFWQLKAGVALPAKDIPVVVDDDPRWAVRLSGLCLSAMAAWALAHQIWAQWQAWCA